MSDNSINRIDPAEMMISVIIPVYKVEQYLPCCMDSVMRQTHRHTEILITDDGSPDRSAE